MKLNELQATLDALNAQLAKATTEIKTEIANLTTQLSNLDLPPDALVSLTALQDKVAALDALNPDLPPPAPTP